MSTQSPRTLFGKPQQSTNPGSVFGGSSSATTSSFGGAHTQPQRGVKQATSSLFSKSQNTGTAQKSLFGRTETGSSATNVNPQSLFSSATPSTSSQRMPANTSSAGTASTFFKQNTHSKSVFGGTSGGASNAKDLGYSAPNSARSLFTSSNSAPAPNVQHQGNLYSSQVPIQPTSQTPKTLFGKQVAKSMETFYSQLSDLTITEKEAFEAEAFVIGCIPLKPPPEELCR